MKRDMELCRTILVQAEAKAKPQGSFTLDIPDHTTDECNGAATQARLDISGGI
jgi:hypothetical protein